MSKYEAARRQFRRARLIAVLFFFVWVGFVILGFGLPSPFLMQFAVIFALGAGYYAGFAWEASTKMNRHQLEEEHTIS